MSREKDPKEETMDLVWIDPIPYIYAVVRISSDEKRGCKLEGWYCSVDEARAEMQIALTMCQTYNREQATQGSVNRINGEICIKRIEADSVIGPMGWDAKHALMVANCDGVNSEVFERGSI